MKKLHNYIAIGLLSFLSFSSSSAFAQQITGKLKATGKQYQRITIPQEYSSVIGYDWGKIRIKDSKGEDVPFILFNPPLDEKQFIPTPFVYAPTDSSQTFVIENISKKRINSFLLKIANSNAQKEYSIEGSNDQNNWFVLVNKGYLDNLQSSHDTYVITSVNFPLNDYANIRIRIQNKTSAPINLLDIGQIEVTDIAQHYEKLKNVSYKVSENKKDKKTVLTVQKQGKVTFDIMQFHIKNSDLYTRPVTLYAEEEIISKKKVRKINTGEHLFDLSNKTSSHIEIPTAEYPASFFIAIQNDDNPALQIDGITLYHKPIHIVAYLDERQTYSLEADTSWDTPTYYLERLNLDFSKIVQAASVNEVKFTETKGNENRDDNNGKLILIISCVAGALIVFYFGFSLIKDMKKGTNS